MTSTGGDSKALRHALETIGVGQRPGRSGLLRDGGCEENELAKVDRPGRIRRSNNTERDEMDNLNSQGMFFKKLCFKDLSDCIETREFDELPLLEA
ncbi:MAG: hypothetical protein EBS89_14230, partial [Proteobacteria bacterium]|nr:hypothetical protein [Pseudomonadota bacterium]